MEEYPPETNNAPVNPKPNRLHGLAFLKVGLFEIVFVTVVLFLLFGILNYFNILSVSAVFPKQLGWLPRQQDKLASQGEALKGSPTNFTSSAFQYDTKKAEKLLTQYIRNTIKPEFLPSKIEVKQGLSIDGRTEDIKYEFGFFLTTQSSTISANFHFKKNSNTFNDFEIFIQPTNITQTVVTVALANSLLSSYFVNPFTVSDCQTKGVTSYCENFQTLNDGKRGYGALVMNQADNLIHIIFNCFVPKESKDYNGTKSCISP